MAPIFLKTGPTAFLLVSRFPAPKKLEQELRADELRGTSQKFQRLRSLPWVSLQHQLSGEIARDFGEKREPQSRPVSGFLNPDESKGQQAFAEPDVSLLAPLRLAGPGLTARLEWEQAREGIQGPGNKKRATCENRVAP